MNNRANPELLTRPLPPTCYKLLPPSLTTLGSTLFAQACLSQYLQLLWYKINPGPAEPRYALPLQTV